MFLVPSREWMRIVRMWRHAGTFLRLPLSTPLSTTGSKALVFRCVSGSAWRIRKDLRGFFVRLLAELADNRNKGPLNFTGGFDGTRTTLLGAPKQGGRQGRSGLFSSPLGEPFHQSKHRLGPNSPIWGSPKGGGAASPPRGGIGPSHSVLTREGPHHHFNICN